MLEMEMFGLLLADLCLRPGLLLWFPLGGVQEAGVGFDSRARGLGL